MTGVTVYNHTTEPFDDDAAATIDESMSAADVANAVLTVFGVDVAADVAAAILRKVQKERMKYA